MAVIKRGNTTYDGVIEKDGKLVCQKCQKPEAKCKAVMHIDGKEFFSWQYECECGNGILVSTKRTGEDKRMWAGR